jgi:hypothetical protein
LAVVNNKDMVHHPNNPVAHHRPVVATMVILSKDNRVVMAHRLHRRQQHIIIRTSRFPVEGLVAGFSLLVAFLLFYVLLAASF